MVKPALQSKFSAGNEKENIMQGLHTERPPQNQVMAVFAPNALSFDLPRSATLEDLAGRLDNQPLGHWIFSATDLIRYPMQAHRLAPGTAWVPAELRGNIPLWARRSIFELGRYPLLICEVFLPDFPAYESI